jgi:hypothetical protein
VLGRCCMRCRLPRFVHMQSATLLAFSDYVHPRNNHRALSLCNHCMQSTAVLLLPFVQPLYGGYTFIFIKPHYFSYSVNNAEGNWLGLEFINASANFTCFPDFLTKGNMFCLYYFFYYAPLGETRLDGHLCVCVYTKWSRFRAKIRDFYR